MRMATSSSTRRVRQSGADLKPPQAAVVKSNGGERCGKVGTGFRQARLREASASEPLRLADAGTAANDALAAWITAMRTSSLSTSTTHGLGELIAVVRECADAAATAGQLPIFASRARRGVYIET